jgi:DNA-binding response OmpR family regulator
MIGVARVQEDRLPAGNLLRVLLIEDSLMLVGTLELVFASFGWIMVGPADRVPKALGLVATETFDVALLDVNLDGEMSWPVASALQARGRPFVLSTGYEIGTLIPGALKGARFIRKPYDMVELEAAILDAMKMN